MVKPYNLVLAVLAYIAPTSVAGVAFPAVVPAVHTFGSLSNGDFQLPTRLRIVVDASHASSREDNGLSLIPPTLSAFAQTFASDLNQAFPASTASVTTLTVGPGFTPTKGDIILTILPDAAAAQFKFASGSHTTEGYQLNITSSSITISGSGAKGSFWGTRTVLQGLVLNNGKLPGGIVTDQPDWETRGFMLGVLFAYTDSCTLFNQDKPIRCWKTVVPNYLPQRIVRLRFVVQDERIRESTFISSSNSSLR
jgi:hexosaminidase